MSKMTLLESLLGRPAMYVGVTPKSMDEVKLLLNSFSVGLDLGSQLKSEERAAIKHFGRFMRFYLHGEDKNCCWEYDMLSLVGDQSLAIEQIYSLLLEFRNQIRDQGIDSLESIILDASRLRFNQREDT